MDKETWNKVKKDVNSFPVREKLLYLKEILKKVKEKDLATEIINEIQKVQEIINNEDAPEEKAQLRAHSLRREEEVQRKEKETLEEELLSSKTSEIASVRYGVTQELEKGTLYGRDKNSLYEQKPYESSSELYESPTQVDMMKESERRLDEYSITRNNSGLEQESVNKKKTYLR